MQIHFIIYLEVVIIRKWVYLYAVLQRCPFNLFYPENINSKIDLQTLFIYMNVFNH